MARTAPQADVVILLITFGLTVMVDLVVAVNIGVILALLHFLRRMAASVEVVNLDQAQLEFELAANDWDRLPEDVLVFAIEGPLFFAAVDNMERALAQTRTDPRALIIRLGRIPFMDITGINSLAEAVENLERRGVRVMLCEANPRVLHKLVRAGLVRRGLKPARYFRNLGLALNSCSQTHPPTIAPASSTGAEKNAE